MLRKVKDAHTAAQWYSLGGNGRKRDTSTSSTFSYPHWSRELNSNSCLLFSLEFLGSSQVIRQYEGIDVKQLLTSALSSGRSQLRWAARKEAAQTPQQPGLPWDQTKNRLRWWPLWADRGLTEVWGLWTRGKPLRVEQKPQGFHGRQSCCSLAGSLNSSCQKMF